MSRFFRRGVSKVHFLPAVADPSAPTRIEMDAGTDLSVQTAEMNGFQFENSPIPTPVLEASFTPQVEGEDTAPNSSIVFYDDDESTTIRDTLAKGTQGYILLLPYGDTDGERCEVWPVASTGVNDEWSMGNDPARYQVPFAINNIPEQNAVVPAAA